ncbi:MAG: GMC oxidoreductase [Alphaproteobacteria bacterium]
MLVEAGIDTPPDRVPDAIRDSYPMTVFFDPQFQWTQLTARLGARPHNRPATGTDASPARRYEQGRVMGGGSSINAQLANRGLPSDYDAWHEMGAEGWRWDDVLPFFRRLERDMDFDGPLHGKDGPLPIRRIRPDDWPGFARAAAAAWQAAGHTGLADQNGEFADGWFPVGISNLYDRRVSSAIAYLDNATRARPNLTLLAGRHVQRVAFEGRRARGVWLAPANGGGEPELLRAGTVILSAGAIHSPAMLMRSGVGPAGHLRDLGIAVVADVPAVGANLGEHPAASVSAWLGAAARLPDTMRRHVHVGLRFSSGLEGCPAGDMYAIAVGKSAWHALGRRLGTLMFWINRSYSRGTVRLASADWRAEPEVDFNMLDDRRDLDRMKAGWRRVASFYALPALAAVAHDAFPSSYSERVRKVSRVSYANALKTAAAAGLMESSAGLRRTLIRHVLTEGDELATLLADDLALEEYLRRTVTGTWHASCSVRMGRADDPTAAADPQGRVKGVEGLRVVDASLMPATPSANTNIPTIMIAEKIADAICRES